MVDTMIIVTFALGFLIASLIALVLLAPMWRRAVNITRKRMGASSPVSSEDFNADKDRMRAEFAMSARKLEMSVENLRKKAETRLAELDKREREVADLKHEIDEKVRVSTAQGEEIAVLKQRLTTTEASLNRRESEFAALKERLAEAQSVLTRQATAIREANSLVEGQKDEIDHLSDDLDEKAEQIARKAATIQERDDQLAKCGRAVAEQKMQVSELRRECAAHETLVARITEERDEAVRAGAAASARERAMAAERDAALSALNAANAEISALKASAVELGSEYAARAEAERRESAQLRERLSDLAVEVDRATGDIDTLLGTSDVASRALHRRDWSPAANMRLNNGDGAMAPEPIVAAPKPSTLAERIRALQSGPGA